MYLVVTSALPVGKTLGENVSRCNIGFFDGETAQKKTESCGGVGFSRRENRSEENLNLVAALAFPVGKTVR